jgi:hypothetical protein
MDNQKLRKFAGLKEAVALTTEKKAFNLVTKVIGNAASKDSRIDDIGQKNENTKKVGQRVHEFQIGEFVFHVIRVE